MRPHCFKSSHLLGWAWDPRSGTLWVLFKSLWEYHYFGVSPEDVVGLQRAESPGTYLQRVIRPRYAAARVA